MAKPYKDRWRRIVQPLPRGCELRQGVRRTTAEDTLAMIEERAPRVFHLAEVRQGDRVLGFSAAWSFDVARDAAMYQAGLLRPVRVNDDVLRWSG